MTGDSLHHYMQQLLCFLCKLIVSAHQTYELMITLWYLLYKFVSVCEQVFWEFVVIPYKVLDDWYTVGHKCTKGELDRKPETTENRIRIILFSLPLTLPHSLCADDTSLLYISLLSYTGGWRIWLWKRTLFCEGIFDECCCPISCTGMLFLW